MYTKFLLTSILLIAISIVSTSSLQARLAEAYFDASGGYRKDKLSAEIHSFDKQNMLIVKDHLKARDLTLYQVGGKGLIGICDWFVRGEGYWGWSDKGMYSDASRMAKRYLLKRKAHLHHGKTKDFTIGAGYFLNFCFLELGPVAGWSYQSQEFKVKTARFITLDEEGSERSKNTGFRYSNHWKGPWLGVDAKFDLCGFELRSGYSYHWAKWNANWSLKNRAKQKFTFQDNHKSSDAHGQVAYLDFFWGFCPMVNLGVGLKWQQWQGKKGRKKPLESEKTEAVSDQVQHARWESFTVSLNLGISF